MLDLFSSDLQHQGAGSFADIQNGKYDTVLPVPYWAWRDRHAEVTNFLAKYSTDDALKFIWPLLKDDLAECLCVFSGNSIDIAPLFTSAFPFRIVREGRLSRLHVSPCHKRLVLGARTGP